MAEVQIALDPTRTGCEAESLLTNLKALIVGQDEAIQQIVNIYQTQFTGMNPPGLRRSVERGSLFGVPTYGWIGAGAKVVVRYAIFLAEIPVGFNGVQSIDKVNGEITITERKTGHHIKLPSGRD